MDAESKRLFGELAKAVSGLSPGRRAALMERLGEGMLVEDLRNAIRASGRTMYEIAKEAGIGPEILGRFMSSERDMRLETASKIADVLGLALRPIDAPAEAAATGKPRPAAAKKPTGKPAARKASKRAPGVRKPRK